MASLWRHPNSNYWTACFTDITGRRRKRSTGIQVVPTTSDEKPAVLRKKAQTIADEYEASSRQARSANKIRSVLMDLHKLVSGVAMPTMSVNAAVAEWLARREVETGKATKSAYKNAAEKLTKWLKNRSDQDIALITRQDLFDYRAFRARNAHPVTVNNELKIIRMLFREAKREGWVFENPAESVDILKVPKGEEERRRPFTMPEVQNLLSLADPEWKSMILCGLYTGQRLGDLCRLKWASVHLGKGLIRLTTGKTGKKLNIPMAPPLLESLTKRRVEFPDATLVHQTLGPLIESSGTGPVSNQFAKILAKAGLRIKQTYGKADPEKQHTKRMSHGPSFHCLRHTAVSLLKEAGIPQSVVMELIGHDSEQMSNHYTHTGDAALLAAVNSLPSLGSTTPPPAPALP